MILRSNRLNARGLPSCAAKAGDKLSPHPNTTAEQFMNTLFMRTVPPFIFWHDFVRGIVYLGQAALQFTFMLAVMYVSVLFTSNSLSKVFIYLTGRSKRRISSLSLLD